LVQLRIRYGAVLVHGAVLTTQSPTPSLVLYAPARHACPAPIAISAAHGSPSELPPALARHFPSADSDCAVLELREAPTHVRTIENVGRVFPLPGEDKPFGFKVGADPLFEAGAPSLPGFRLIGGGGARSAFAADLASGIASHQRPDVVELSPKWRSALRRAIPSFPDGVAAEDSMPAALDRPHFNCALVKGPRGVGKSLFARTLLNAALTLPKDRHNTAVAFLDLDLGQTEFGPPGMVTLNIFPTPTAKVSEALHIGPPWTTLRQPIRAHFVGDTSPKNAPRAYLDAATDLIRYYQETVAHGYQPPKRSHGHQSFTSTTESAEGAVEAGLFQSRSRKRRRVAGNDAPAHPGTSTPDPASSDATESEFVPLIVNTQGWIQGLGADLLGEIEALLRPSHIFDLSPPPPDSSAETPDPQVDGARSIVADVFGGESKRRDDDNGSAAVLPSVTYVQPSTAAVGPQAQARLRLTAADQRALMLVFYLHAETISAYSSLSELSTSWNFDAPLAARAPVTVEVNEGLAGGVHVLPFGGAVRDEYKLHALNGSVVALVERQDEAPWPGNKPEGPQGGKPSQNNSWASAFGQPLPRPSSSRCLGLALVRSVSRERREVHLLGPLDTILRDVDTPSGGFDGAGPRLALVKGAIDLPIQGALDFESIEYLRRPHLINFASSSAAPTPAAEIGSSRTQADGGQEAHAVGPHGGGGGEASAAMSEDDGEDDDDGDGDADGAGGIAGDTVVAQRGATVGPSGRTLYGVPVEQVPYLEWPSDDVPAVAGGKKRRVRRNLQRRAH